MEVKIKLPKENGVRIAEPFTAKSSIQKILITNLNELKGETL